MHVLVTGGRGFVGGYLADALKGRGHDVTCLDLSGDTFRCDITDGDRVAASMVEIRPDAVIHLAAISRVNYEDPGEMYRVNVQGTVNLLAAAASLPVKPKFLYVSSSQVYGNPSDAGEPVTEDAPVSPVNHYGAGKAAAENIARAFRHENDLPVVIARPFNHTGLGQTTDFVLPKIVRAFREGTDVLELGNIDTVRDFLDVRDVVRAYCAIIEDFHDGEVYNIASGQGVRIRDVITTCEGLTGRVMSVTRRNDLVRRSEIRSILGSSHHIEENLGWKRNIPFRETLSWMLSI